MALGLHNLDNLCLDRIHLDRPVTPAGMGREQFRAMGTTITLLLPETLLYTGAQVARQIFERWEQTLSRFRSESELSRLNRHAGEPVRVSGLLFHVIRATLAAAQESDGLFDPGLLLHLQRMGYDRSFDEMPASLPERQQFRQPGELGGAWRDIQLSYVRKSVTLPQGTALDLGGIAKGMAVDATLKQLRLLGIRAALVNAGGDLAVMGMPAGYESWPLTIEGRDTSWLIPFAYGALATSGVSRRHWQQGTQVRHHLIDPRTGESAQSGLWSVTVAASTCEQAEVAAKVAFLLGAKRGSDFLNRRGLAGLLVAPDEAWTCAGPWPYALMQTEQERSNSHEQ